LYGSKGLGEYVSNLHDISNGQQFEKTRVKFFTNNLDVLGVFMKDLIGPYLKEDLLSQYMVAGWGRGRCKS